MNTLLTVVLVALGIPAIFTCVYLAGLTVLSAAVRAPAASRRAIRFDVIVPAHNESSIIERTVASLRELDWPTELRRILVVADNCNDDTAALARAAGACVLERFDPERRGKGYALDYAFKISRAAGFASAVVIIDADAKVSTNLLEAFAARIEAGEQAVQAHYGVLNPWASWRTRLLTIAKASFHIVRSRAREHLKFSCGVRGNGWCVTHELLARVPYRAFSLTEDLEYGIELGLAGVRVAYADEAHSDADMASTEHVARKQRQRWEAGRFQLVRSKTVPLLVAAARRRSLMCLDLAFDLLTLPLSYVVLNVLLLAAGALAAGLLGIAGHEIWAWIAAGCAAALVGHVLRGWQLSGLGARGLQDLARAPFFLAWKLLIMIGKKSSAEWIRTEREPPSLR
jgi:cellulose synthase/poly-beta-1,6-N-acetylglucosamine synthase-like glycosyltransferase